MNQDRQSSILLGRPCYYVQNNNCDPSLWTNARYSERVVDIMAYAIRDFITRFEISSVRLIGYSGGGSLAMLLATRITEVEYVDHYRRKPRYRRMDGAARLLAIVRIDKPGRITAT